MKKESRRSERVSDLVRAELSRLILTEAHDPELKRVTITEVEMPPDLKSARVYFSCLGGDAEREKAGEALRRAAGYLRREVGQRCGLRYAPELRFVVDLSLEHGARIEELLHKVLPHDAEDATGVEGEPKATTGAERGNEGEPKATPRAERNSQGEPRASPGAERKSPEDEN
ncbi:MAG TPA: 30S ribosome-binding factor RbfA [Thermoanaerobaculia bacterium]|nr:30S ribosome-binding factor RbfA [Thermoanaerobaculia bacterium]